MNLKRCIPLFIRLCKIHSKTTFNFDTKAAKEWKIFDSVNEFSLNFGKYAVLILNSPVNILPKFLSPIWNKAACRVTVDGGADRWLDYVNQNGLALPLPNLVTGDFDSIKPETLEFYKKQDETTIVNTPDQDLTDFTKSVKVISEAYPQLKAFLAITEHSGRLDQIYMNVNTLYTAKIEGYLLSGSSLTWLLRPGSHLIHIPEFLCNQNEWCGILPFDSAKVSTNGLKWNLDNNMVQFGGLISSSNTYTSSPVIELSTDGTVTWTMSCGPDYKNSENRC